MIDKITNIINHLVDKLLEKDKLNVKNATIIKMVLADVDDNTIYELKDYHAKRSLSQNSYAWVLISKLGDSINKSKEEVYFQMLKDYGQSIVVSIRSDIDITGKFKYYEEIGKSNLNGKEFTHYKIYTGSSQYNTSEMKTFIDGIIQECSQLGIETMTPDEVARLNLI